MLCKTSRPAMGNGRFAVSDRRLGKGRRSSSKGPEEEREGGVAVWRKALSGRGYSLYQDSAVASCLVGSRRPVEAG